MRVVRRFVLFVAVLTTTNAQGLDISKRPGINGNLVAGNSPSTICKSVRQTAQAETRSSNCPGSGRGFRRLRNCRGSLGASSTIARMTAKDKKPCAPVEARLVQTLSSARNERDAHRSATRVNRAAGRGAPPQEYRHRVSHIDSESLREGEKRSVGLSNGCNQQRAAHRKGFSQRTDHGGRSRFVI